MRFAPNLSVQVTPMPYMVTLEAPFLEYVRVATLAVRNYYGEF